MTAPREANEAVHPAIEAALRGAVPPQVALMRMLLDGLPASAIVALLDRLAGMKGRDATKADRLDALAAFARRHSEGLALLERMAAAGADHGPAASEEAGVAATRAMFDRLVRVSPEASVAAYSLGDAALLDQATAELVAWLRERGLLAGRPAVLDLGCGIGRLCAAVAPEAGSVLALDVSQGMVAAARTRCAGLPNLTIGTCSGRDLAGIADGAFDLVLAVDVFPYLVQAAMALAERHMMEAARVLRRGGALVIANFSYRGDAEADGHDVARLAAANGLAVVESGARPFALWDGAIYSLRREGA
jgi:SAM-dependent methyltransferase